MQTSGRPASRSLALAATALAIVGSLTACGDSGSSAPADLTVYSGRSEVLVESFFEDFTEKTGVTVDVRYGDSAELAAALLEEGDKTPADVFLSQDAGALGAVSEQDIFTTLPTSSTSLVPAGYRAKDGSWVGVTGRARVIAYNKDKVPAAEVPTTIAQLTDPKWKGQIGIAPTNASFQAFVTALRVSEGEAAAKAWLEAIAANQPQIFDSNVAILDAVNEGTVSLGLINHYYWFEKAAEVGAENLKAQLKFTEPGDVGSLVNASGVGITTTGASNPKSQALVDYLLSEEGQKYFAEETFEYPLVKGIPAAAGLPALAELKGPDIALADLASLSVTLEMLDAVGLT